MSWGRWPSLCVAQAVLWALWWGCLPFQCPSFSAAGSMRLLPCGWYRRWPSWGEMRSKKAPNDLGCKMTSLCHPASPTIMPVCMSLSNSCTTCLAAPEVIKRRKENSGHPRFCNTHRGGLVPVKAAPIVFPPFARTR